MILHPRVLFGIFCCTLVGGSARFASACTGMYVGKKASADGTVLIGRTVDLPPWNACFRAVAVPRGNGIRLAHVCTPAVTSLGIGPFHSVCANEAGFVVSGTVSASVNADIAKLDPTNAPNAVGERDFTGLLAANCATAREALDFFAKTIAERGHVSPEIYMFADREEAWYAEVYTAHQWAAVKMPEDKVACFGNQFMLRSFDPRSPETRHSPGLLSMPENAGLLKRGADGLPDLFATYVRTLRDYANFRTWFGHRVLAPSTTGEYRTDRALPLFYAPDRKIAIADLFELMRSRYEGTAFCPDEHPDKAGIRTIGTTKQATSHVISLDPRLPARFAGTVWFSLANAEHSVFLPMNAAATACDPAFSRDNAASAYGYDAALAGNAFRRLCALAELNRPLYGTGVRAWWRKRELELLANYPKALARAVAGDDAAALTSFSCREQARAFSDARRIFDDLMWYVAEHNRLPGDSRDLSRPPVRPFAP